MVKAHVSPGFGTNTRPQTEQRSSWCHLEKSRPSPQCGQRLRSPRRRTVRISFEREGVIGAWKPSPVPGSGVVLFAPIVSRHTQLDGSWGPLPVEHGSRLPFFGPAAGHADGI